VPIYQSNQPPEYPGLARRRGWEGTVLLEVDVSEGGLVKSVQVHTTSSHDLLDNAALDAVKNWGFQPGTKGGKPVAMRVLVPVHFVLKDIP
jgi:protein TonB